MELELINHETLKEFRQLIIKDRVKKMQEIGKNYTMKEHGKFFGFVSNGHFNLVANGKVTPSLACLLDMVDRMGLKIVFEPKDESNI